MNASEIVAKSNSIKLQSEADLSKEPRDLKNSQVLTLKIYFGWCFIFACRLCDRIHTYQIKQATFIHQSCCGRRHGDENNTFQTNLSISNDIETRLDLVRTYIEMDDWDSAEKILGKLISNSKNSSIIANARSLLEEKK